MTTQAVSKFNASLALSTTLVVASFILDVHGCVLTIRNNCGYSVTACARSGGSATSLYNIPGGGGSQDLDLGGACAWPSGVVFASASGACDDAGVANLAELNIGNSGDGLDYYDLSNVDAYAIGLQIVPADPGCKAPRCSVADVPGFCGAPNRLDSFASGAVSCHNADGQIGYATDGNRRFKDACPDAYSYNFDDATSTWTCGTGIDYQVVFCP